MVKETIRPELMTALEKALLPPEIPAKKLKERFEDMERAMAFTCLLRGKRLVVQEDGCQWHAVLGILSACCPVGIPLAHCAANGKEYWSLDLKDDAEVGWALLLVKDPEDWKAPFFCVRFAIGPVHRDADGRDPKTHQGMHHLGPRWPDQ